MIRKHEIPILENYAREFGKESHEKALLLGLEVLQHFK